MPQCIIECSSELSKLINFNMLVEEVHNITESSGYFVQGSVKSRLHISEYYLISGDNENFIHVTTNIFTGRSIEERKNLADLITKKLCVLLPTVNMISVEVKEINKLTHSNRNKIQGNNDA